MWGKTQHGSARPVLARHRELVVVERHLSRPHLLLPRPGRVFRCRSRQHVDDAPPRQRRSAGRSGTRSSIERHGPRRLSNSAHVVGGSDLGGPDRRQEVVVDPVPQSLPLRVGATQRHGPVAFRRSRRSTTPRSRRKENVELAHGRLPHVGLLDEKRPSTRTEPTVTGALRTSSRTPSCTSGRDGPVAWGRR